MRKTLASAVLAASLITGLTGCGLFDPPRGVVIEKDHDPETYSEDENWDITVLTSGGREIEWDVTKRVFDGCSVDDPATPTREAKAYFNGKACE